MYNHKENLRINLALNLKIKTLNIPQISRDSREKIWMREESQIDRSNFNLRSIGMENDR
jgi:hypothetical protein